MRYFLPLLLFCSVVYGQEKKFTVECTFKGAKDGRLVYMLHKYNDVLFTDSAFTKGEKVKFACKLKEPNMFWFTVNKNSNTSLICFIDDGKVEINGHIDSLPVARVKAGKTQADYIASQELVNKFNAGRALLIQKHNAYSMRGDQQGAQRIIDSAMSEERAYAKNIEGFVKSHPSSNASGYFIYSAVFDWPQIPEYDAMYNALGENVKKGKFGKLAADKIKTMKGTTIGYPALDFTQADVNGKNISLSSYKGKVVLVDFWASWCGPCRRENPSVVAAYNKYKEKGFDVLGVSMDDNKDKWLSAIAKDNLTWTHVSDLKGWQNAAGKMYGVQSIPFNLLLDKEGKILAKNLRGPDLENKLEEVLGK